ncbi:MAG: hypothetical protein J4N36_01170 [Chloroflexi bacterium]|nr:hypothetical protein [Chloroflexota bacterium]MCH8052107.1 hypothetical protein [Chloroflexota bacterium]MCH8201063.1 hypothetical protein [Chloroflexota bacterium]MCI0814725.1 hypothetical protein [Chloroflexota bacterium]MCI0818364.1 hypothetical protein [Chloroflexota bacterium]
MEVIFIVAVVIVTTIIVAIPFRAYLAWSDHHHNGELRAVTTLDSETVLDNIVRDFVSNFWSLKEDGEDWVVRVPDFFSGQLVVRTTDHEEDTEVRLIWERTSLRSRLEEIVAWLEDDEPGDIG